MNRDEEKQRAKLALLIVRKVVDEMDPENRSVVERHLRDFREVVAGDRHLAGIAILMAALEVQAGE